MQVIDDDCDLTSLFIWNEDMVTDNKGAVDLDAKFEELMALSPTDRIALAERLIESVPTFVFGSPEEERAFNEEIARRIEEHESGRDPGIPAEQVFAEIRARSGRRQNSNHE